MTNPSITGRMPTTNKPAPDPAAEKLAQEVLDTYRMAGGLRQAKAQQSSQGAKE